MNLWIIAIALMVGLAILGGWKSFRRFDYIGEYHLRSCQGQSWKMAFPDVDSDEIRDFLRCLAEGMDFEPEDYLKFRPDDEIIAIYRSFYGGETPPMDEMECERFIVHLCDAFGISEETIMQAWTDELTTLGTLFAAIQTHQTLAPKT